MTAYHLHCVFHSFVSHLDMSSEKKLRGALRSEVDRVAGGNCIVLVDSLNHIKVSGLVGSVSMFQEGILGAWVCGWVDEGVGEWGERVKWVSG